MTPESRPALNTLLQRQLKRLGLTNPAMPPAPEIWRQLLEKVSRAYTEAEQERYLMERSQAVSSSEMNDLNRELREAQGRLKSLVSLSSDWVWEQNADLCFTYFSEQHSVTTDIDPAILLGTRLVGSVEGGEDQLQLPRRDARPGILYAGAHLPIL